MLILFKLAIAGVTLAATLKAKSRAEAISADQAGSRLEEATARATDSQTMEAERINRSLVACAVAMGLAAPPLRMFQIASGVVTLYADRSIFAETYEKLIIERKVTFSLLESLTVITGIATGYLFFSALASAFYYVGRGLVVRTRTASIDRLVNDFGGRPQFVWRVNNGIEVKTAVEDLAVGDLVVAGGGEVISVDGRIKDGTAVIDQRALTGESQPVEKGVGDEVFAATLVLQGSILMIVEKPGVDSLASRIEAILNQTAEFKPAIQLQSEILADRLVLPTLAVSVLAIPRLGITGAVAVLSSNFTEVLGLTAPLNMLNHVKLASDQGILIKDGSILENMNKVDTIIFDKTGTLTLGDFYVGEIHTASILAEDEVLTYAAAAEQRQTHPIASAILAAARERGLPGLNSKGATQKTGFGVKIQADDKMIAVGSARFLRDEGIDIPQPWREVQAHDEQRGFSHVYVAADEECCGMIQLRPTIRPEAIDVVGRLKRRNLDLLIVSGDHENPTRKLAANLGIDRYVSESLPEDKADLVEQFHREGKTVCFVGDGINDTIALKKATVSVSMHGASSAAVDTAQVVLMDQDLAHLDCLFDLAASYESNLKTTTTTTYVPSALCMAGSLLGIVGISGTFALYIASLSIGIGAAMRPKFEPPPLPALPMLPIASKS